jgi:hypothetical protein
MAGRQIALTEHRRIAERRPRFSARGLHLVGQRGQFADDPHPTAAASRRRLDQYGQRLGGHGVGIEFLEHRHTRCRHHLLGFDLGAHRGDRGDRRTDPREAGVDHRCGEFSVLRKEPVPGVDRVGAGRARGGDQLRCVQITAGALEPHPDVGLRDVWGCRVGIGVDGDRADPETAAGGKDAARDLTTVGDQDFSDHGAHIRKTPKFDVPLIGPLAMADRHIPRMVRVSRGSITPSS